MQSRWPRVAGLMSMKATVRSSSCTLVAGISPATILQNRQSGSAIAAERIAVGFAPEMPPDTAKLREVVETLERIERPSASAGEREAAEWIRGRFEALGLPARIEPERAHGTYWWPLGAMTAAAS